MRALYELVAGSQRPMRSAGATAVGIPLAVVTKSIGPFTLSPINVNPDGLSLSAAHVAVGDAYTSYTFLDTMRATSAP